MRTSVSGAGDLMKPRCTSAPRDGYDLALKAARGRPRVVPAKDAFPRRSPMLSSQPRVTQIAQHFAREAGDIGRRAGNQRPRDALLTDRREAARRACLALLG